jgi:2-octaprenyl-6-methoxyphenol hydroxylase
MDARLTHLNKNTHTVTIEHAFSSITITPTLLVAADGMHSAVRHQTGMPISITPFHQQALIANVRLARKHHNVAYERFTTYGPLALLPLQEKQVSLVWGLPPLQAQEYQAMPEKRFLALLQETFGYQLGAFVQVGKRSTFPLMQAIMPKCAAFPYVFIGNAAHTLHPVAGQGFNLGLRDVACLAECIIQQGLHANMLQNYLAMRRYDQASIRIFTQTLLQLFTQSLPGSRVVRGLGMLALDTFPGLQQEFMRHTRGFAGVLPKLVCNIPL